MQHIKICQLPSFALIDSLTYSISDYWRYREVLKLYLNDYTQNQINQRDQWE